MGFPAKCSVEEDISPAHPFSGSASQTHFQGEPAGLFAGAVPLHPFQTSSPPAGSQCSLPTPASEAEEHMIECAPTIHSGLSQDSGRKNLYPAQELYFSH